MKSSHSPGIIPGLHDERKKQEGGNRKCQDVHPSACSWPETLLMNKTGKLNACSSPCLLELLAFQSRTFTSSSFGNTVANGEHEENHLRLEVIGSHSFQELRASCANDNTID